MKKKEPVLKKLALSESDFIGDSATCSCDGASLTQHGATTSHVGATRFCDGASLPRDGATLTHNGATSFPKWRQAALPSRRPNRR